MTLLLAVDTEILVHRKESLLASSIGLSFGVRCIPWLRLLHPEVVISSTNDSIKPSLRRKMLSLNKGCICVTAIRVIGKCGEKDASSKEIRNEETSLLNFCNNTTISSSVFTS
jgi:hypothetical protein